MTAAGCRSSGIRVAGWVVWPGGGGGWVGGWVRGWVGGYSQLKP